MNTLIVEVRPVADYRGFTEVSSGNVVHAFRILCVVWGVHGIAVTPSKVAHSIRGRQTTEPLARFKQDYRQRWHTGLGRYGLDWITKNKVQGQLATSS
jgi:hypothetical protein